MIIVIKCNQKFSIEKNLFIYLFIKKLTKSQFFKNISYSILRLRLLG